MIKRFKVLKCSTPSGYWYWAQEYTYCNQDGSYIAPKTYTTGHPYSPFMHFKFCHICDT